MMRRLIFIAALCCLHQIALSQPRILTAVKTLHAPVIDGNLTDAAWQQAPVAKDFIQNFPNYGSPASAKTEVRILYDNDAIYIGAYLYDDPSLIRKQITARDGEARQNVDYFSVFFDTYNDQQNGFQFLVTTANVQTDAKLNATASAAFGEFGDRTWDAVWQSQVQMQKDGWTVEMKIPYLSLRFSKKDVQTWGLQFLRYIRRYNENDYWNPVDPNTNGFANQFGKYVDLKDIKPPLRLSFSPYLSTGIRIDPDGSPVKSQWLRNGGMDVKYGINESFTLDATLIPDFGQVVSDNLINNLSPFEVRFQENRPFFTEGTELFNKSQLFYSRRIGTIPSGYYAVQNFVGNNTNYRLVNNPSVVQLYNGIKFSGRTKKKLGIGIFNAVTAPMHASLQNINTGKDSIIQTEPLTNYNIIVLDQALKGRSSLTFTNTNVIRQGNYRDANVSAFDWALYTANNKYQFKGTTRYSKIFGYTPYYGSVNLVYDTITRNGKLFVKPYSGVHTMAQIGKVSGKVQYFVRGDLKSNTYDPTDLGYLQTPNLITYLGSVSYNQFSPTKNFVTYSHSLNAKYTQLYKPYTFNQVELWYQGLLVFKNFWDVTVYLGILPAVQNDYFELRTPGLFLKRPPFRYASATGSTDSRKPLFVNYALGYARTDVRDGNYYNTEIGARYRFSNNFTLSIDVNRMKDNNQIGYAFVREANGDPIAGYRRSTEITSVLSGIYNFTSRLNLTMRARHYWNKINYKSFYNVASDGSLIPRAFYPGLDENYNLFNLDAFVTWDFRLGSRLIAGYKNWLGDPYVIDAMAYRNYLYNLQKTFGVSHGNEFTVKFIYFLDYNQLKKKK